MVKKRFIAGAVCPRCGEMDRLVSYQPEGEPAPVRECVACGFLERLVNDGQKELPTRVNQERKPLKPVKPAPGAVEEQVIRFFPLPSRSGKSEDPDQG